MPTTINIADKETLDGVSTKVSSIYNKLPSGNIANSTDISSIISSLSTLTTKVNNLQTSVNKIPTTGGGGGDRTKYAHVYNCSISVSYYSKYSMEDTIYAYIKAPSGGMFIDIVNFDGSTSGFPLYSNSGMSSGSFYVPANIELRLTQRAGSSDYMQSIGFIAYANSQPTAYHQEGSSSTYGQSSASATATLIA